MFVIAEETTHNRHGLGSLARHSNMLLGAELPPEEGHQGRFTTTELAANPKDRRKSVAPFVELLNGEDPFACTFCGSDLGSTGFAHVWRLE